MNISGLESNFYLSDNPIFVRLSSISVNTKYITISARNTSTQEQSSALRYYRYGNMDLNIDISSVVKSMMPNPKHSQPFLPTSGGNFYESYFYNNSVNLEFTFSEITDTFGLSHKRKKTFIRGGKRTYESNQNLSVGDVLSPTEIIPIWNGFPINYYYLGKISQGDGPQIFQETQIIESKIIPEEKRKYLKVKGCEPQYVKFLNSLGGYSYWLFENWETEESNDNLGSILGRSNVTDLGNEYESEIELISKIPQQFLPIIKDLIFSKEIYLYDAKTQEYTRISSDSNNVKENPFDVNFKVKLKFKLYNRYNPSLIW